MNFFTSMDKHFKAAALFFASVVCFLFAQAPVFAQQQAPPTPEEQEKQLTEYIQKEVDKLETILKLEDWQVFYVDSILTHDYHALQAEMNEYSSSKVSNYDIYSQTRDKWNERMYNSMHKVFNDEQWAKYLKNGAGREKKSRDKRKVKLESSSAAKSQEND